MKAKLIPYSISDLSSLRLTSCHDVGVFRKFFSDFEMARIITVLKQLVPNGISMKMLSSVTGLSIMNKASRFNHQM